MPTIKPFRDYDEHDVINLYAFQGSTANKGTFVTINQGYSHQDDLLMLGDIGANYSNIVSERYGVKARVSGAYSGAKALGMLLMDVRETDENGELLKFNPRKAKEMGVVITGQAVPIARRGRFLWSGFVGGAVTAGADLYCAAGGALSVNGGGGTGDTVVAVALGATGTDLFAPIELTLG